MVTSALAGEYMGDSSLRDNNSMAAWLLVSAWVAIIFVSVFLARSIQAFVLSFAGQSAFTVLAISFVALVAGGGLVALLSSPTQLRLRPVLWLVGVLAIYGWWIRALEHSPEETLHFIEYGVLALLLLRALKNHVSDNSIFITAAIITAIVGTCAELVQWLTPGRFFDYRDLALNAGAGTLVLLAVAKTFSHSTLTQYIRVESGILLARLALVEILLLALCLSLTPPVVSWIAREIPALSYLRNKDNITAEYGYEHEDSTIGVFFSRFSQEELQQLNIERGEQAGRILNQFGSDSQYEWFLANYNPLIDPYIYEIRVHLFRRDRYLERAIGNRHDQSAATVAYRENQILGKYFPNALFASGLALPSEQSLMLEVKANTAVKYQSEVSKNLIVMFTVIDVWIVVSILLIAYLFYCLRASAYRGGIGLSAKVFLGILTMVIVNAAIGIPQVSANELKRIKIAFYSDVHAELGRFTPQQLVHRAEIINASEPDVIIGGGDYLSLTTTSTAQDAEAQWGLYLAMFDALKPPVLQALGNHDMARSSLDARIEFRERLRLPRHDDTRHVNGYAFIVLDSLEDADDNHGYKAVASARELVRLRRLLEGIDPNTPIVLVTHIPLITNLGLDRPESIRKIANSSEIFKSFENRNLVLVLQGHMHQFEEIRSSGLTVITAPQDAFVEISVSDGQLRSKLIPY